MPRIVLVALAALVVGCATPDRPDRRDIHFKWDGERWEKVMPPDEPELERIPPWRVAIFS